jgi:hypothetical protein
VVVDKVRAFNVKPGITPATGRERDNADKPHEKRLCAYKCLFRPPAKRNCQRSCLCSTGFPLLSEAYDFCCLCTETGLQSTTSEWSSISSKHVSTWTDLTTGDCSIYRNLAKLNRNSVQISKSRLAVCSTSQHAMVYPLGEIIYLLSSLAHLYP